MKLPKISINIPIITSSNADIAVNALRKVKYPKNLYEIILVKGNHLTKQRNKGIKHSKGEIIYLLDNDSQIHPHALKIIASEFSNPKVAAVGGPSLTPINSKYFSQLVGFTLETFFGAFRMRHKWSRQIKTEKVNDYLFIGCNLALQKKAALEVGGFDERFQANDETELLRRLADHGYLLRYNPKMYVYRHQRNNITALMKQFHHYGKGRMQHVLKNPKLEDAILIPPVGFTLYLLSLFIFHPNWYFAPLIMYTSLGIATSLKASVKNKRLSLLFIMPFIFPIIHISYAVGLLNEVNKYTVPRKNHTSESRKIIVKIYKQFSDNF